MIGCGFVRFQLGAAHGICYALRLVPTALEKGISMSDNSAANVSSQEKLVKDIKLVIADAEEMLLATADQTGDRIAELRARIKDRLLAAQIRLEAAEAALVEKTRAAARATDDYVHENPWQAVGIGAGIGFLLGLVLGRR